MAIFLQSLLSVLNNTHLERPLSCMCQAQGGACANAAANATFPKVSWVRRGREAMIEHFRHRGAWCCTFLRSGTAAALPQAPRSIFPASATIPPTDWHIGPAGEVQLYRAFNTELCLKWPPPSETLVCSEFECGNCLSVIESTQGSHLSVPRQVFV